MKKYIVGFNMRIAIPVQADDEDLAEDFVRDLMSQDDFNAALNEKIENEDYEIDDHSWFVEEA